MIKTYFNRYLMRCKTKTLRKGTLLIEVLFSLLIVSVLALLISYFRAFIVQWHGEVIKKHEAMSFVDNTIDKMRHGLLPSHQGEIKQQDLVLRWHKHNQKIKPLVPIDSYQPKGTVIDIQVSWPLFMNKTKALNFTTIVL